MSDLGSLLPAISFGIAIGLLVYVLILRSHQKQTATALHAQTVLLNTLREERDQAIQHAILNEAKEALSNQFKNLANEILEDKSKKFTEHNAQQLDILLKPLQTKLTEFKEQVSHSYDQEARERFALKNEIERLANLNIKMSDEARSLTNALKGDSKIQGNWGELVLESILESSGLRKGEEYLVQDSHAQVNGGRLQPDVIVKLPEGRHLIIDSKVSVTAYARHTEASDSAIAEQELLAHIQSIRQHIQGLSAKNYAGIADLSTVDFVLMFIPIEPAFLSALKAAPNLYQDALSKNIILVCPSTLMATLRTVAHLWRQDQQNKNAMEIARQCASLYDKFVGFVEDLEQIGKRLDQAQSSYHDAFNKLKSGKGNLIKAAERVKELGVKPSKMIANHLQNHEDE